MGLNLFKFKKIGKFIDLVWLIILGEKKTAVSNHLTQLLETNLIEKD